MIKPHESPDCRCKACEESESGRNAYTNYGTIQASLSAQLESIMQEWQQVLEGWFR